MERTIKQAIMNGPNRWSRILGHATINGAEVRLQIRIRGFSAVVEYTDATRENDTWHQLGGSYSQNTICTFMLRMLPCMAQFNLTPAMAEELAMKLVYPESR